MILVAQSPLLMIGSGNMGIPVIASLLKHGMDAAKVTVITGAETGNTSPQLTQQRLNEEGVGQQQLSRIRFIPRNTLKKHPPELPATILYATKPQYFQEVCAAFAPYTAHATTLISIAAGLDCNTLQALCPKAEIIRTMPNLARRIYGLYASEKIAAETIDQVTTLFSGMGEAIALENEFRAFPDFTVHSGCTPAFIAALIARLQETGIATQARLLESLTQMAENNDTLPAIQTFCQLWLAAAEKDFGPVLAPKIVSQTILGTVEALRQSALTPGKYANTVRSAKGVTNAGLLCMGLPVPDNDGFGTEAERAEQNALALHFKNTFPAELALLPALIASKARLAAMAASLQSHPLALAGVYDSWQAIENAAKIALTPRS